MTFSPGPSGTPPGRSGSNPGFGTPRPGFGQPGGGTSNPGTPGGFGAPPPFGSRPHTPGAYQGSHPGSPAGGGGANAQPVFGGAATPPPGQSHYPSQAQQPQLSQQPQPPQATQYSAPPSPKGKGKFSGAIAALIAILVVLAIALGVGAWFIWGRDSSGSEQAVASADPTTTAVLAGNPIGAHDGISTDLTAEDAVIARTLFPDSYVSHGGSTNIADIQLAQGQSQLNAVFGFIDDRDNTDVATASVTVTGSDGTELATFDVPADEALEMPIHVGEHQELRFTFTYKDKDGNPADNTGFAVASLNAQ